MIKTGYILSLKEKIFSKRKKPNFISEILFSILSIPQPDSKLFNTEIISRTFRQSKIVLESDKHSS